MVDDQIRRLIQLGNSAVPDKKKGKDGLSNLIVPVLATHRIENVTETILGVYIEGRMKGMVITQERNYPVTINAYTFPKSES